MWQKSVMEEETAIYWSVSQHNGTSLNRVQIGAVMLIKAAGTAVLVTLKF